MIKNVNRAAVRKWRITMTVFVIAVVDGSVFIFCNGCALLTYLHTFIITYNGSQHAVFYKNLMSHEPVRL